MTMASNSRGGRRPNQQHAGNTYAYAKVIKCNTDEWLGEDDTTYEVLLLCCNRKATRTHKQLTQLRKHGKAECCIDCTRSTNPRNTGHIGRNQHEMLGLIQSRERERQAMLRRVAAKRARNQAAVDAAHRRAIGERP